MDEGVDGRTDGKGKKDVEPKNAIDNDRDEGGAGAAVTPLDAPSGVGWR